MNIKVVASVVFVVVLLISVLYFSSNNVETIVKNSKDLIQQTKEEGSFYKDGCTMESFNCPDGSFIKREMPSCLTPVCSLTLQEVVSIELEENWLTVENVTGITVSYPESFSARGNCVEYGPTNCEIGLSIFNSSRQLEIYSKSLSGTPAENMGSAEYMRNNLDEVHEKIIQSGYSDYFKFVPGASSIDPGPVKTHPNFVTAIHYHNKKVVFLINDKYLYEITMPIADQTFDKIASDIVIAN